jgi:hypothetical protein
MSLLRLLTAGKSWVGIQEPGGRYRFSHPGALPKFEAKKNLFREKRGEAAAAGGVAPEQAETTAKVCDNNMSEGGARPSWRAVTAESGPEAGGTSGGVPGRTSPTIAQEPMDQSEAGAPADLPVERGGVKWVGQTMARVRSWFERAPRPVKPAIPRFHKPMVQGELSLENIKVVRNDLSDTDLEVVPSKVGGRAAANSAPALKAIPVAPAKLAKPAPVETAWGRMSAAVSRGKALI